MKRREFCKTTLFGGALSVLPAVRTCSADTTGTRLSGEPTRIPSAAIKELAGRLRGRLITRADPDYDQARRLYEQGAALGNDAAINGLGVLYDQGHGVPHDSRKARQLFEKAAALGNPEARENLRAIARR